MKLACPAGFLMVILAVLQTAPLQAAGHRSRGSESQRPQEKKRQPIIAIYTTSAPALSGYLEGLVGDTILIRVGEIITRTSARDITSATIMVDRVPGKSIAYMALMGFYLGNIIAYHARGSPTQFYSSKDNDDIGLLAANTIFVTVGGGLGYLLSVGSERDIQLTFGPTEKARLRALRILRKLAYSSCNRALVHFATQAAYTDSRTRKQIKSNLESEGAAFTNDIWTDYLTPLTPDKPTDLNLLRKLELTLSLSGRWQAGLAYVHSSEPILSGRRYDDNNYYEGFTYLIKGHGLYAVGKFYLNASSDCNQKVLLFLGGGLGRLKSESRLHAGYLQEAPYEFSILTRDSRSSCFSQYLFGGIDLYISRYGSVSLVADYVLAPSYELPGIPEVGLGTQKISPGNFSAGLALGLHL